MLLGDLRLILLLVILLGPVFELIPGYGTREVFQLLFGYTTAELCLAHFFVALLWTCV